MPKVANNQLTVKKVESNLPAGRYLDGGGLYLNVTKGGAKQWIFRFSYNERTREMGLGSINALSLADARQAVIKCRQLVLDGINPIEERKKRREANKPATPVVTFKTLCEQYIKNNEDGWKSSVHRNQWRQTMETYAYPIIGDMAADTITIDDIGRVVMQDNMWLEKHPTATNVRGRIETVLNVAVARGIIKGENPARLVLLKAANIIPQKVRTRVTHHAAMPYDEIPTFMEKLTRLTSSSARALAFTILTGARTGETIGAVWSEIDIETDTWVIPEHRMKADKEHRVPLSPQMLAVIPPRQMGRNNLFPGHVSLGLSNMSMTSAMRKLRQGANSHATVHGFRSSLRDWLAEETEAKHEVAEMCLAHATGSAVTRAYRRTDYLDQRRALMRAWSAYCLSQCGEGAPMLQSNALASRLRPDVDCPPDSAAVGDKAASAPAFVHPSIGR